MGLLYPSAVPWGSPCPAGVPCPGHCGWQLLVQLGTEPGLLQRHIWLPRALHHLPGGLFLCCAHKQFGGSPLGFGGPGAALMCPPASPRVPPPRTRCVLPWEVNPSIQISPDHARLGSAKDLTAPRVPVGAQGPAWSFFAFNLGWCPWRSPLWPWGDRSFSSPSHGPQCWFSRPIHHCAITVGDRGRQRGGLVAAGARRLFNPGPAPSPSLPSSLFQPGRTVFW